MSVTLRQAALLVLGVLAMTCASACGRSSPPPDSVTPPQETAARGSTPPASAPASDLLTVSGRAPAPVHGSSTLVLLEPHGTLPEDAAGQPPVMDQASLTFFPNLLIVRTGRPVSFQNHDSELHNINVFEDATKEQSFNIALPNGGNYAHTFKHDGFYSVRCDIHPAMSADIVSVSSPYATLTDSNGGFRFEHVVPGKYLATVYAAGKKTQEELVLDTPRSDLQLGATP